MLDLPHPLLSGHVDVERAGGRRGQAEEHRRSPEEHHEYETERNHRPRDLEDGRLVDLRRDLVRRATVVPDREVDDERPDQKGKERRDGDQEAVERVDAPRVARRLLRKDLHQRESPGTIRKRWRCRRDRRAIEPARRRIVATPARRTMFRTTAPYLPLAGS